MSNIIPEKLRKIYIFSNFTPLLIQPLLKSPKKGHSAFLLTVYDRIELASLKIKKKKIETAGKASTSGSGAFYK